MDGRDKPDHDNRVPSDRVAALAVEMRGEVERVTLIDLGQWGCTSCRYVVRVFW
jgi:hypothetical protein